MGAGGSCSWETQRVGWWKGSPTSPSPTTLVGPLWGQGASHRPQTVSVEAGRQGWDTCANCPLSYTHTQMYNSSPNVFTYWHKCERTEAHRWRGCTGLSSCPAWLPLGSSGKSDMVELVVVAARLNSLVKDRGKMILQRACPLRLSRRRVFGAARQSHCHIHY